MLVCDACDALGRVCALAEERYGDPQEPQQLVIQRPGWEVSRSIRTLTMESPR